MRASGLSAARGDGRRLGWGTLEGRYARRVDRPPVLTVISPFFNEAEGIAVFCRELRSVLDGMGESYEVILVDDGSTDGSLEVVTGLAWPQCSVVQFVTNAGHQAALDAGVRCSRGDFVVTMDSDLQHPPALVPVMLKTARTAGVDVVYGVRSDRAEEKFFKRSTARWYYRLMRALTGVPVIQDAADFRLMSRFVVGILNAIPDKKVFRLILPSLGFTYATVPYKAALRNAGTSKYSLRKMLALALRSSVEFSPHPLRIVALLGLATSLVALIWFGFVIVAFLNGSALIGWPSLMSVVLVLGGITLFSLGVIGEYVGEIYDMAKGRPRYVVRSVHVQGDDSSQ